MSPAEVLTLFAAGTAAGTINTVVGSGSLITFPALLAFGYPPLLANVTNNIGVLPGSLSGLSASGTELRGQRRRIIRLASGSAVGGVIGSLLVLRLPSSVFDAVVPALVLLAVVLVILQPRLTALITSRRESPAPHGGRALWVAVLVTGVYGGYFGASQGVLLIAILGVLLDDSLPRLNAIKNVLAGVANLVAAAVFATVTDVAWGAALTIGVGAVIGGQVGARVGRRLPPRVYRTAIVVVGLLVVVKLLID